MAEGAREWWGLVEWDLARSIHLREHLRYLAGFTPAQRQEAMSDTGLLFATMSGAQQWQFLSYSLVDHSLFSPLPSLDEFAEATVRVECTQPGWFQWGDPDLSWNWTRWMMADPGREGRWRPRPTVRERTREAALQAARRIDLAIQQPAVHTIGNHRAQPQPESPVLLEEQIFPTKLNLTFVYIPGFSNARPLHIVSRHGSHWQRPR